MGIYFKFLFDADEFKLYVVVKTAPIFKIDYQQPNVPPLRLTLIRLQATHISVLPVELLNYVFRWVVSLDLDMRSLENISEV